VLREVLRETHELLGYRLDLSTVGTLEDFAPAVTTGAVARAFGRAYDRGDEAVAEVRLGEPVLAEVRRAADLLRSELG
jgi:hypothetical protein